MTASRASTLALYVGGFLGPFGAGVLAVLIPGAGVMALFSGLLVLPLRSIA